MSQTVSLNAAANTLVPVTFDNEVFDPYGFHSTTVNTSRIIPTVPGRYQISAVAVWTTVSTTGGREALLRMNGSTTVTASATIVPGSSFGVSGVTPSVDAVFNGSTDYVELIINQNAGATLAVNGCGLTMRYVRSS